MFKRTVAQASAWAGGLVLISSWAMSAGAAHALETPTDFTRTLSKVEGKVYFQKRSTIVPLGMDPENAESDRGMMGAFSALEPIAGGSMGPLALCRNGTPCSHPTNYWSMIVMSGNTKYEFHRPVAAGSTRQPEFVELQGVVVRPGARVQIVGTVENLSPTYGVISDVKNITVVMDQPNIIDAAMGMTDSVWGPESMGWNCQSATAAQDVLVNARVWYGKKTPMEREAFHLRIIARKSGPEIHYVNVAELSNLEVHEQLGRIVYEGSVPRTEASLAIRPDPERLGNFPSTLKFSQSHVIGGQVVPVQSQVRMYCNPVQ